MALLLATASCALADGPGVIESWWIKKDFALTANPGAGQWKNTRGVFATNGKYGELVPGHRTEIRSRWTKDNIYFLFSCEYLQLNLKPDPSTFSETNKLWDWDVAEAFIGSDFEHIHHYKEFQVSPQGEFVDLDIDRKDPKAEGGWQWNSGFTVMARIDKSKHWWYGEMKIPIQSIDRRFPRDGLEMRINFYRLQGPGPKRIGIAWQPVNSETYHTPEAFGKLVLKK